MGEAWVRPAFRCWCGDWWRMVSASSSAAESIDLIGELPGDSTHRALAPHTMPIELFGHRCACLDLPALIRTKVAAARPKDFEAIAELVAIRRVRG